MKRLILTGVLLLPMLVHSQYIKTGVILGVNASQVDGDGIAGFKRLGLNTGLYARIPLAKHFSASIELLYSQKGSRQFPDSKNPGKRSYKLALDYAEIPLLIEYQDLDKISAGLGFSVGQLVRFKETRQEFEISYSPEPPVKKRDYNIVFTASYLLAPHWDINLRYAFSLANISLGSTAYEWREKHTSKFLSFRVIYNINPE